MNNFINDIESELLGKGGQTGTKIHLRLQQRGGKKCFTIMEGAEGQFDMKENLSVMKKKFSCGGAIKTSPDGEKIITMTGDQRQNIIDFLTSKDRKKSKKGSKVIIEDDLKESDFVVHGY